MLTVKVYKPKMEIPQSYVTVTDTVNCIQQTGHGCMPAELTEVVTWSSCSGVLHHEVLVRGEDVEIYVENEKGKTVMAYKSPPPAKQDISGSIGG